eukprot:1697404-Rhodomonas_salina.1
MHARGSGRTLDAGGTVMVESRAMMWEGRRSEGEGGRRWYFFRTFLRRATTQNGFFHNVQPRSASVQHYLTYHTLTRACTGPRPSLIAPTRTCSTRHHNRENEKNTRTWESGTLQTGGRCFRDEKSQPFNATIRL